MKRLSLLAVIILMTASVTQAQKQYNELEFPELNEFNEPDVETFTTDNGIKFYLVEDKELPLIDVNVDIRTGGVLVPDNKTGLASLTGQVMRSGGTSKYPSDSLNVLLENNAANMSTYIGFTQGGASMNVLEEDFDNLLPVFVDLLTNPAFPEEKIELAKKQTKSGISRRNDNAGPIASREFDKLIYGENSKYAQIEQYDTINNITREDMVNFHSEHFNGQNMRVGVVGDFNTEAMKEKLRSAFGDIPAGEKTELAFPEVDYSYQSSINLADKPDVNQSTVYLGHIGAMRDNPDYAKVQVMNNVLSGGFSGRLFQKVRTDLGLAYSVGGSYGMSNTFYPGTFTIQVQTKTGTTAEAIDAIIEEVKRLQNEPISEEELQDTKDQFLNSLVFRNTSYEQILNRRMSNDYRGLPEDSFEQFVEGVRNTTVEDVQEMAQKYLQPQKMEILVVGNKSEMGDQLTKYGDVNELDISIPQPGADKEKKMVEGDAQKGRELLDNMTSAIIDSGTEVNSLSYSGEIFIQQLNQAVPVSTDINFAEETVTQNVQAPQGTVTFALEGGQSVMKIAGQERPLPPSSAQAKGLKSTLNQSIIAIARNAGELEPKFTGTEDVDGNTYNKVNITIDETNITLLLSQETNLPRMKRFQQFNPQQGGQIKAEMRYSNWTSSDGVNYPYKQVQYQNGEKAAESTYSSHTVNGSN